MKSDNLHGQSANFQSNGKIDRRAPVLKLACLLLLFCPAASRPLPLMRDAFAKFMRARLSAASAHLLSRH